MLARPEIIRKPRDRRVGLDREAQEAALQEALSVSGYSDCLTATDLASILDAISDPLQMEEKLNACIAPAVDTRCGKARVRGALDGRLIILPNRDNAGLVFVSLGPTLGELAEKFVCPLGIQIAHPDSWVSHGSATDEALEQFDRPHVKLISLYHPENFPLPRFALGISDIARSLRKHMLGRVTLCDMQLGPSAADVVGEVERDRPEVIGISSTFGQHDVFEEVVAGISRIEGYRPLLVAGGSLSVLNAGHLASRGMIVALGAGELTMPAVVRHWLGQIPVEQIPGACFRSEGGELCRTEAPTNRLYDDILPELDLLLPTIDRGGVMQLESSRGCSYACSFCPREHKGIWAGENGSAFEVVLPHIRAAYDSRPHVARKIFLVDEEFYGYHQSAEERVEGVADAHFEHGFRFETSSRVDQVWRPSRDRSWHVQRLKSWRALRAKGLERCLFGVESGVDSILRRFNKKTTAEQNVIAVRLLTSLGVPIRCTYITFDPLMSRDELRASFEFQGRKDLILRPRPEMSDDELFEAVTDEGWVRANAAGKPFFSAISYMLVSMECLLGSPYLAMVEARGLAGPINRAMGRRDAAYLDPVLGAVSHAAQSWVDRNFSFDYTLKSLEKVSEGSVWSEVRALRAVFKSSAYELLGMFLDRLEGAHGLHEPADWGGDGIVRAPDVSGTISNLLDAHFEQLVSAVKPRFESLAQNLDGKLAERLRHEHAAWSGREGWEHINAS